MYEADPLWISGAIHRPVPTSTVIVVPFSAGREMPKSVILPRQLRVTKMFPDLRSRCRMGGVWLCRKCIPLATSQRITADRSNERKKKKKILYLLFEMFDETYEQWVQQECSCTHHTAIQARQIPSPNKEDSKKLQSMSEHTMNYNCFKKRKKKKKRNK